MTSRTFLVSAPRRTLVCLLTISLAALTGCGLGTPAAPSATTVPLIKGLIHGGQQPIQGAYVVLYVTNLAATSYGAPATIIGTATTDENSNFTISPSATSTNCPAGSQAYITAAGGSSVYSPGSANNSLLMMAALGDCRNINANTFVIINEVTTVAAAYALSGFISTVTEPTNSALFAANVGAPVANNSLTSNITPTAPAGLAHAFLNATNLVNTSSGMPNATFNANSAGATTVGTVPATLLNTLADILQSCINSGTSTSNCTSLFSLTPSISGVTPTNTLQAFVNLARNPYPSAAAMDNSTGLLSLAPATGAFQPTLSTSPTDWSLAVVYNDNLAEPYWMTLDQNDTVYLGLAATSFQSPELYGVNPYGVSVPVFGVPSISGSSAGIAADALGNVWVASSSTSSEIDRYSTTTGTNLNSLFNSSSLLTGIAVDKQNNLWIAHGGVKASGSVIIEEEAYNPASGGSWASNYTAKSTATNQGPYGIAVDANQNIWAAGYYSAGTTELYLSNTGTVSAPTYTTTGTVITPLTATVGTEPYSTVFDASGNAWVGITGSNSTATSGVQEVTPNTTTTPTTFSVNPEVTGTTLGAAAAQQIAIDGAGTIFIPDNSSSATEGLHMYSTVTGNVLSPLPALRSTSDAVTAVTLNSGGAGCTSAPTIALIGGGGTGATATATVSGSVTSVAVNAGGTAYTSAPTVKFSGGGGTGAAATATIASGAITAITVTNGGSGYTSAPTVAFTGGAGKNAKATANVTLSTVSAITVNTVGTGYTSAPTVSFSGGGCTTAPTATATVVSIDNPRQIVIDSTGSVWTGFNSGGVTQIIGLAAPAYPLLSVGMQGLSPGLTAVNPLP